jgi:hypothetical protein
MVRVNFDLLIALITENWYRTTYAAQTGEVHSHSIWQWFMIAELARKARNAFRTEQIHGICDRQRAADPATA